MKVFFSVNSPKIDKRKINRGEDAPPVNKDGIMIICDGTGATGQSEHTIGSEVYTSAYLGSRETSTIAEEFLTANYDRLMVSFGNVADIQKIVMELGEMIRDRLMEFVQQNDLSLTVLGKSFKLLPTTFTAVVYKAYETKVEVIVLCAGDSRALWWDTQGLHQLSFEDSNGSNLFFGDCNVSNCVSADADFFISFGCHTVKPKGVLLATSDGFTDPAQPFDQERYLIEWIGNFNHVCEKTSEELSEEIARKMDAIGFTRRDDCSIAGVIVGYSSDAELKDDFRKRYTPGLIESYIKPYKELKHQFHQTEAELSEARSILFENEDKIVACINEGILSYLQTCDDTSDLQNEALFESLMTADAISLQVRQNHNLIENDRKEKAAACIKMASELKDGYLDFLKMLCRYYGSVRFSDELIAAVREYYETEKLLKDCSQNINRELAALQGFPHTSTEMLHSSFLDGLEEAAGKLLTNVTLAKEKLLANRRSKATVDQYFHFQNEDVERFFREDIANRFAILKKTVKIPLFQGRRQAKLKMLSNFLLEQHDTLENTKSQITDSYIRNKKNAAYREITISFSGDIARELFHKDKYRDYLTKKQMMESPELMHCEQLQKQLEQLFTQRELLFENYNHTYQQYLNMAVQGKVLFRRKGVK